MDNALARLNSNPYSVVGEVELLGFLDVAHWKIYRTL